MLGLGRNEILAIAVGLLLGALTATAFLAEPSHCFKHGENQPAHEIAREHAPASRLADHAGNVRAAEKPTEEKRECKSLWGPEWTLVWVTLILCSITGVLAWFTYGLFSATAQLAADSSKSADRQFKLAEENAKQQLRAYIAVMPGASVAQGGGRRKLRFQFDPVFLNTGQTPAYELQTIGAVKMLPYPLPSNFDFALQPIGPKSVMTLGSQQSRFATLVMAGRLTIPELKAVARTRGSRIYVYGSIKYRDAFEEWHYTNYCYSMIFSFRKKPIWNTTELHNESN